MRWCSRRQMPTGVVVVGLVAGLAGLSGGCPVDPCNIFNCETLFFIEDLFEPPPDAGDGDDGHAGGDGDNAENPDGESGSRDAPGPDHGATG